MIYLPVTCNILTAGHVKIIHKLSLDDNVKVGLLTKKALKGYKEELVPFKDRMIILKALETYNIRIVPQDSLDPTKNIIKYKCDAIASGDGWEEKELACIKKLGLRKIDVKLRGEKSGKLYSSSKILCQRKK